MPDANEPMTRRGVGGIRRRQLQATISFRLRHSVPHRSSVEKEVVPKMSNFHTLVAVLGLGLAASAPAFTSENGAIHLDGVELQLKVLRSMHYHQV